MSNPTTNPHDEWRDCQPGELKSLTNQLRRENVRRNTLRAAVPVALAACLLVGVGIFSALVPSEPSYGGIVCSDVKQMGEDFVKGLLTEVEAAKIVLHLEKCDHCKTHIDRLRETQNATTTVSSTFPGIAVVWTFSVSSNPRALVSQTY